LRPSIYIYIIHYIIHTAAARLVVCVSF
jgi:hypothetical protein